MAERMGVLSRVSQVTRSQRLRSSGASLSIGCLVQDMSVVSGVMTLSLLTYLCHPSLGSELNLLNRQSVTGTHLEIKLMTTSPSFSAKALLGPLSRWDNRHARAKPQVWGRFHIKEKDLAQSIHASYAELLMLAMSVWTMSRICSTDEHDGSKY